MDYTAAQRQAIETIDRNLQIIACAGSGKTQVISARIVRILQQGVPPSAVVAFTFTEKAAGELKDRIDRLARETLGSNQGLGDMFVGTIHGYCLALLQSPPLYRYLKYTVLDEVQQRLNIDRHSTQSGLTSVPLLNGGGTLSRWKDSRHYQNVISIYREADVDEALVPEGVRAAVDQYTALMHEQRYLDYTMIMSEAVAELETNPALRQQIAGQVRYVVVDEYQDVNPLQERLVRALHELGANLCVVGDDDQTIYQWRGSEVDNIITFARRTPDVVQVRLNENFRSSPGVVDAARGVVELNDERLPKRMESVDAQPFAYGDILACHFADPASEAEWIVAQMRALHGTAYRDRPGAPPRGLAWSDFAVLLRSVKNDAAPIVDALAAAGIPFVVGGMNGLFNTPEIEAMRLVFSYTGDFSNGDQPPVALEDVGAALRRAELGLSEDDIGRGLAMLAAAKAKLGDRTMRELVLQRVYLEFLEALRLYEDRIPTVGGRTGELVFYNLGKFSQVITDYEQINLRSGAASLHNGFASFLHYQAPGYYPEGWEEGGLGVPDAVQIMTVHKAKGMQWPAVFVPCLRKNRFPAKGGGGRQWYHILPEAAVANAARYRGSLADERRLFYVAVTRAERYLFCSYSPVPGKTLYNNVSTFFQELTASSYVLTQPPPIPPAAERLMPQPRRPETALALTFSELKYYFDCAYSFKLRFQYGFDAPTDLGLGFGRSLHNALAEIHHESLRGRVPTADRVPALVAEHLYLPYASEEVRESSRVAAEASLQRYLRQHGDKLSLLEHVEKNVELKLADGIVVTGRIDLIRRTDTGQTSVVDFKSNQRAQAENITRRQLQVYTVGYEQLTGRRADLIEVHNLDGGGVHREQVDQRLIDETVGQIVDAGRNLRDNHLPRLKVWCDTCAACDFAGVCRGRH